MDDPGGDSEDETVGGSVSKNGPINVRHATLFGRTDKRCLSYLLDLTPGDALAIYLLCVHSLWCMAMKNITLSADENLIASARVYAQAHGTTLNDLIRDY